VGFPEPGRVSTGDRTRRFAGADVVSGWSRAPEVESLIFDDIGDGAVLRFQAIGSGDGMTLPVAQKNGSFGRNPGRDSSGRSAEEDAREAAEFPPPGQKLKEDMVDRFRAMIESVTDELMVHQPMDRDACRADAITMLMAVAQDMAAAAAPEAPDVSGVVVEMLHAEQKLREGSKGNDPEKAKGPEQIFTFLRA
jgi:hypothetical protein